jgi:RNA polymerase sigma factor (sigma-70 family)
VEPWRAKLADGDSEAAWGLFIERYQRLLLATIRRTVDDAGSVMDAFAHVCSELSADELTRLNRYDERRARFTTWLVTIVHHLTIDWLRKRNGRPRVRVPDGLSPLQLQIFQTVFVERRSHTEAYELVCSAGRADLSFGSFLQDLAETYRVLELTRSRGAMGYLGAPEEPARVSEANDEDLLARASTRRQLAEALASLPTDDFLALQLYVVEELPATDVARRLGWRNAKAVYNRVHRALSRLRAALELQGLGPGDL